MRLNIMGSDGLSLLFHQTDRDIEKTYLDTVRAAEDTAYAELRRRHGIWASNQGRYVDSPDKLNAWDSRIMERRFERMK